MKSKRESSPVKSLVKKGFSNMTTNVSKTALFKNKTFKPFPSSGSSGNEPYVSTSAVRIAVTGSRPPVASTPSDVEIRHRLSQIGAKQGATP